jgi:hypothetical protein
VVVVVAVGGTGGVVGAATEIGSEEYGDYERALQQRHEILLAPLSVILTTHSFKVPISTSII